MQNSGVPVRSGSPPGADMSLIRLTPKTGDSFPVDNEIYFVETTTISKTRHAVWRVRSLSTRGFFASPGMAPDIGTICAELSSLIFISLLLLFQIGRAH